MTMTTSPGTTGNWNHKPATPASSNPYADQRGPSSGSSWTVGKVIALVAVIALVLIGATIGITSLINRQAYEAEQAARPADTVAAKTDKASAITAPKCADDQSAYWIPVNGEVRVLVDDKWAAPKEAAVTVSAPFAANGVVGKVTLVAKAGEGVKEVKFAKVYAWRTLITDNLQAGLTVTRYEPVSLASKVSLSDTGVSSGDVFTACMVVNR